MLARAALWGCLLVFGASLKAMAAEAATKMNSPDGRLSVQLELNAEGVPTASLRRADDEFCRIRLGLELGGKESLRDGFKVAHIKCHSQRSTYLVPVGKRAAAHDRHEEMVVFLTSPAPSAHQLAIAFRAFDDGIAFQYRLAAGGDTPFELREELTELTFPGDPVAHLLPLAGYTSPYEGYYQHQPISKISSQTLIGVPMLLERTGLKTPLWLAVTEANLVHTTGMYLSPLEGQPGSFISRLSLLPGRDDGVKVTGKGAWNSAWRIVMAADNPGRLIESDIVFNLSEPSKIEDASWIKPGRTTFPWWNGYVLKDVDFKPGVNTATMKHYIDFCAKHGIEYHSLDGLDIAWYGGPIAPVGPTDVTKATPEINMRELLGYAKEKGVRLRLWMHWKALKPQLDEALAVYEKWGIEGIMVDFMDRDDQEMVAWYHEVAEKCAKHHLTVTWHGAYKPVGMERTWPNVLTSEAVMNQEYNKWDKVGTTPEHNLNVAFIRTLAGPLDYHSGGMRTVLPESHQPHNEAPDVQGTRGQQLAMWVVYENHLPMLADYPEAYEGQPGFDFLCNVPCNWDETKVLHADFGKSIVVARRKGDTWYLGGMAANDEQTVKLSLQMLDDGPHDVALIEDDVEKGPTAIRQSERQVTAADELALTIPRAGGFVATIRPVKK